LLGHPIDGHQTRHHTAEPGVRRGFRFTGVRSQFAKARSYQDRAARQAV